MKSGLDMPSEKLAKKDLMRSISRKVRQFIILSYDGILEVFTIHPENSNDPRFQCTSAGLEINVDADQRMM